LPASNLPPAWRTVKITSRALFLVFGCTSTGMPRPSSSMVIDDPSLCSVTRMFDA
jgi:hypothetical protein